MSDDDYFHSGEVTAQGRWQTTHIWDDARRTRLLTDHNPNVFHERIENAPFFFLASSSINGSCDCSYKGGGPGIVQILDGARLKVNGRASVHNEGAVKELFPNQPWVILIEIEQVVPNCAAHIPRLIPEKKQ